MAVAIVHMVKRESFGKAFAFGEILGIIREIGWGNYILWLIIMFVCAVIVGGIGNIPVIGWLLSLIIAPIFGVLVGRSASLMYSEALPPVEKTPIPSGEKKYCVYCGAEMTAEAIFCPNCGRRQ